LEELRTELEQYIELYGREDPRTVAKSQELDVEIVKAMKS
jgi:hypothetical protein